MIGYLFVYGTLMRGFDGPQAKALASSAPFVGRAVFQGKLYLVDTYPGAVPSDNPHDQVHGEVYQLAHDPLLAQLDDYEECSARYREPTLYKRILGRVVLPSGSHLDAWLYIYNLPTDCLMPIKDGRFVDTDGVSDCRS